LFNLGVENLEKSSRETRSRGYPQLVDRWPTGAARRMATRIWGRLSWTARPIGGPNQLCFKFPPGRSIVLDCSNLLCSITAETRIYCNPSTWFDTSILQHAQSQSSHCHNRI